MSSIPYILFRPPPRGVARTTRIESRQDCWRVITEVAMLRLCWELKLPSDQGCCCVLGGPPGMENWVMVSLEAEHCPPAQ